MADSNSAEASMNASMLPQSQTAERKKCRCTCNLTKNIIFLVVLVGLIIFVIVDSLTTEYVKKAVDSFLTWVGTQSVPVVICPYSPPSATRCRVWRRGLIFRSLHGCDGGFCSGHNSHSRWWICLRAGLRPGRYGAASVVCASEHLLNVTGHPVGILIASAATIVGAFFGAVFAFLLGRYALRDTVSPLHLCS